MVDRGGVVTWAGASIHELLGYEPDELVGMSVFDLVDPASHNTVIDALARTDQNVEQGTTPGWRSTGLVVELLGPAVAELGLGGVAAQPVTIELMDRPAGAIICWWMGPTRSPFIDGTLSQVADQVALVLQWDQGRQALEWKANHDSLTGLGHRRAFVEDFHERNAQGTTGAVFYLDLDDFKAAAQLLEAKSAGKGQVRGGTPRDAS